jgi:hypothetical protein
LSGARNPVLAAYGLAQGGSLVGLQFAFRSTDYARQTDSNVAAFHDQTGVFPALVGAYFDFHARPEDLSVFLDAVREKAAVPSVTLDPKYYGDPDLRTQKALLARIAEGKFDPQLAAWADAIRGFGKPIVLRFAHEMNGDWYPYGGGGDADGDGHPDGPEAFIRAWRHVHDRFAAQGARNIVWAFCPNGEDFPDAGWNRPFRYYPGDAYVDVISVDAYEHSTKRTQSLPDAMEHFLSELGAFLEDREAQGDTAMPAFGLGEFGTNRADPGRKAAWYAEALAYLASDPRVQFHFLYDGQNGTEDFSLRDLPGKLGDAYAQPSFRYRLFGDSAAEAMAMAPDRLIRPKIP